MTTKEANTRSIIRRADTATLIATRASWVRLGAVEIVRLYDEELDRRS